MDPHDGDLLAAAGLADSGTLCDEVFIEIDEDLDGNPVVQVVDKTRADNTKQEEDEDANGEADGLTSIKVYPLTFLQAKKHRGLMDWNDKMMDSIKWIVCQYLVIALYCDLFTLGVLSNKRFAGYIQECGEPFMLLSFACFAACLLIEQLPINGRNFYSTVFYGLFLTGSTMYFSVFPPFGLFPISTFLVIFTVTAIYATVFALIWCTGGNGGYQPREEDTAGMGCGLYLYSLTVVPTALFVLSQMLFFMYVGFLFDLSYGEYTANIICGIGIAMMICYERFLFLFFFLKREHKEFLKMENVLVTVVKEITNEEQEDLEE